MEKVGGLLWLEKSAGFSQELQFKNIYLAEMLRLLFKFISAHVEPIFII